LAQRYVIQFSIDYDKKFLIWFRTTYLTHLNSGFLDRLRTTYHRQHNKRVAKRLWGCVNTERQHSNTCCNFWYRKTFYYSDRHTAYLKIHLFCS